MATRCTKCNLELPNGPLLFCPECYTEVPPRPEEKAELIKPEINLPIHLEGTKLKEYKVLSQRDNWFTGNFSPERVEEVLNHLAQEGWRVITITTVSAQMTIAGNRQDVLIFLERDRA